MPALSPRSVNVVVVLYLVILPANVCLFSCMMTCVCVSVLLYVFRNTSVHTHTRLVTLVTPDVSENAAGPSQSLQATTSRPASFFRHEYRPCSRCGQRRCRRRYRRGPGPLLTFALGHFSAPQAGSALILAGRLCWLVPTWRSRIYSGSATCSWQGNE